MASLRLQDKVALITGAANGIGRAAAALFAEEGATVLLCDIDGEAGQAAAAEITAGNGKATFLAMDVADAMHVAATFDRVRQDFGALHILYNNAGGATARDGNIVDIPIDEFWRAINVDLFGTFLCCRAALPILAASGGGAVINTASIRSRIGTAGADAYSAAKGGVEALTRALALQWAEANIRINAVAPGMTLTPRVHGLLGPDAAQNPLGQRHLLGPLQPAHVARAALFLASDDSAGMTGLVLPVDSGASAT